MKKMCAMTVFCLLATGCQVPQYTPSSALVEVSWKQEGKDCVYEEFYGSMKREWDKKKQKYGENRYVNAVKTITYGNTLCAKVIDAELKNRTNKSAIENNFHEINSIRSTTNFSSNVVWH